MTQKLKKILAACLILGVGIVWIPQILAAGTKGGSTRPPEVPALGSAAVAPSGAVPDAPVATLEEAASLSSTPSSTSNQDDLARSLENSIARAKRIAPEHKGLDLEKLASAFETPPIPTTPVAQAPSIAIDPLPAQPQLAPLVVELAPTRDPIDDFLATHPLQGTLIGATQRRAYLGPLIVTVGDEPVEGLVVTAIEARFVTLSRGGRTTRVDLTPFQARPPLGQTSNSVKDQHDGTGALGGAAPTGGAQSVSSELEKLLPLLKEAGTNTTAPAGGPNTDTTKPATGTKTESKDGS